MGRIKVIVERTGVPRDESGSRGMNQGPTGKSGPTLRIRARSTNQGPQDELGSRSTNRGPQNETGSHGRIRAPRYESGP